MPAARSVALGLWIGVGSRFEEVHEAGVSHFLEHLLFKGTPRYDAQQIAEVFDGIGGEINAATSRDSTVVFARVLDEQLEIALDVIADMLQHPTFADMDREREVVLEEIAMYEDEPQDIVHDMALAAVFPDHPLGRPVLGRREVIASIPEDGIRGYHANHYRASNIVLAGAGGIDEAALPEYGERFFSDLGTGEVSGEVAPSRPSEQVLMVREKATEQYHLCVAGRGTSRDDSRRHAQTVLDTVLGGSMSSRLFQEIREKRGLVYSVGSFTSGFAETGLLGVYLGTREENLAEACEILGRELERIADEPLSDDVLQRTKKHIKGRVVLGLESPGTRMQRLGRAVLSDTEVLSVDEVLARIDAVTADDVQELGHDMWRPENLSAAAIGPDRAIIENALSTGFAHLVP